MHPLVCLTAHCLSRAGFAATRAPRQRLAALGRLVDAGKLRLTVQAVPLVHARQALAEVADRHTRGKIVLRIGQ